ncbi:MAG: GWxTD domain-containing protein [Balneolales bacterium]
MYYRLSILWATLVVLAACSRAFDPDIRTGAIPRLTDGQPEIQFSAIAYIDDEVIHPVIDVDLDIMYGSLIYRERGGVFSAGVIIQTDVYLVIDEENEEFERIESVRERIDVRDEDRSITRNRDTFSYNERIEVDPGKYMVVVQVTDRSSNKSTLRRENVVVFDPNGSSPNLTHIKVYTSDLNHRIHEFPLTTYSIPAKMDTIKFEYQVTRPEGSEPLAIQMRLMKFTTDTLPPRPISGVTPSTGTLQHRGINYNKSEVIESQERILDQETGTITIEYITKRPSSGNYRFEVDVGSVNSENPELYKARDFSSMSENFPNVISAYELAKPLVYLMRRGEYREMLEISDKDSLKNKIDRFWLSNMGNKDQARRVIEEYYQRVEHANKQFTNFKEGWMTDMGMVYVLFGPPWYVERTLNTMVWIYGHNRDDPNRVFRFERTRMDSDSQPFEHYILQRQSQYHTVEYEQIQRWLYGTILVRPL